MKKSLTSVLLIGLMSMANAKEINIDFESLKKGAVTQAWKCVSRWEIEEDKTAPSGKQIFSMKNNKKGFLGYRSGFNLCYNSKITFKDGVITVKFRANSGSIDQGGGIIWRVQDKKNYYVARFNPLEDNFRFYKVINGNRTKLKSANIKLSKGWHEMKILQKGSHFEGYLDNKKLLDCNNNAIGKSGAVGLWTKADAATSFDDMSIKAEK
jgi:hypothetical protein